MSTTLEEYQESLERRMSPRTHERRQRGRTLAVLAATVAVIAGSSVGYRQLDAPVAPPETGTANLWVATTAGASPSRCSPACAFDATKAYGSFQAAYAAANPSGDTVCVTAGTFSAQTVTFISGKTTPATIIQGCGVTKPVIPHMVVGQNNGSAQPRAINFKGLQINGSASNRAVQLFWGGTTASNRPTDLTFDGNDICVGQAASGPCFEALGSLRLTIKNNTIGPACCGNNAVGASAGSPIGIRVGTEDRVSMGYPTNTDLVIDNNLVQGITRSTSQWLSGYGSPPQSSCINTGDVCHADAIQIYGATNLTVTKNRLYHNQVQGLFLDPTDPFVDGIVCNNMIGDVMDDLQAGQTSVAGISFSGSLLSGTWTICNNTLSNDEEIRFQNPSSAASGTILNVYGNSGRWSFGNDFGLCSASWPGTLNMRYNNWRSGGATGCGGNEITGTPSFVSEAVSPTNTMNLALATGLNGVLDNALPVAFCLVATDINGTSRPQNSNCEAGAWERNQ